MCRRDSRRQRRKSQGAGEPLDLVHPERNVRFGPSPNHCHLRPRTAEAARPGRLRRKASGRGHRCRHPFPVRSQFPTTMAEEAQLVRHRLACFLHRCEFRCHPHLASTEAAELPPILPIPGMKCAQCRCLHLARKVAGAPRRFLLRQEIQGDDHHWRRRLRRSLPVPEFREAEERPSACHRKTTKLAYPAHRPRFVPQEVEELPPSPCRPRNSNALLHRFRLSLELKEVAAPRPCPDLKPRPVGRSAQPKAEAAQRFRLPPASSIPILVPIALPGLPAAAAGQPRANFHRPESRVRDPIPARLAAGPPRLLPDP
jgi:hypothetical protein